MNREKILELMPKLRLFSVLVVVAASGWLSNKLGVALAAAAFFLIVLLASQVLFDVYDLSDRWIAFQTLFAFMFGLKYPYLSVSEGKIEERSLRSPMAAKMGGPGILLVGKGSAVLLERQKGQFRVVGPGSYFIDRADRVRGTVDLRLQRGEYELDDVFTRDGIPLHIKFTVLYRIIQSEEMLIKQGRYEPDLGAVIRALLSARDWMAQTEIVARARLRDTIAEYRLDDLHAAFPQEGVSEQESFQTPRVPLQEELETRLNEEAKDWGVEIARVTLDDIRMPEEVNKQMLEAWGAHWQDIVKSQEAETEARAAKTRARGQADAFIIEARGKKNAAELAGKAMLTEARAKADASVIERRAEAEAIAEYVRRVLGAYQVGGRPLDETMLKDLLKALASLGLRVSPPSLREEGG